MYSWNQLTSHVSTLPKPLQHRQPKPPGHISSELKLTLTLTPHNCYRSCDTPPEAAPLPLPSGRALTVMGMTTHQCVCQQGHPRYWDTPLGFPLPVPLNDTHCTAVAAHATIDSSCATQWEALQVHVMNKPLKVSHSVRRTLQGWLVAERAAVLADCPTSTNWSTKVCTSQSRART